MLSLPAKPTLTANVLAGLLLLALTFVDFFVYVHDGNYSNPALTNEDLLVETASPDRDAIAWISVLPK